MVAIPASTRTALAGDQAALWSAESAVAQANALQRALRAPAAQASLAASSSAALDAVPQLSIQSQAAGQTQDIESDVETTTRRVDPLLAVGLLAVAGVVLWAILRQES